MIFIVLPILRTEWLKWFHQWSLASRLSKSRPLICNNYHYADEHRRKTSRWKGLLCHRHTHISTHIYYNNIMSGDGKKSMTNDGYNFLLKIECWFYTIIDEIKRFCNIFRAIFRRDFKLFKEFLLIDWMGKPHAN